MRKLMKYEFFKTLSMFRVLLFVLFLLECGFFVGLAMKRDNVYGISLTMLTLFSVMVYGYVLINGIVSYSRELSDRTGYLVFLTPVRPLSIVVSKLLYTMLAAIFMTAVFAIAAWFDYVYLLKRVSIDPEIIRQIDMGLKMFLGDANASVGKVAIGLSFIGLTMLSTLLRTMCTSYLAITVSATIMQNRKGFLRALVSFALFGLLEYGAEKLGSVLPQRQMNPETMSTLLRALGIELVYELSLSTVFAGVSAYLLDKKVSL